MTCRGFTVIELMVTLAVASILIAISSTDFSQWVAKNQVDNQVLVLRNVLNAARQRAIDVNSIVTLCPSTDQIHCSNDWHNPLIIFSDKNKNAEVDVDEQVWLHKKIFDTSQPVLKKPTHRSYFRFNPQGFTHGSPGNISFCAASKDLSTARQIVLSLAGRVRHSRDIDGDGIHDTGSHVRLDCRS